MTQLQKTDMSAQCCTTCTINSVWGLNWYELIL